MKTIEEREKAVKILENLGLNIISYKAQEPDGDLRITIPLSEVEEFKYIWFSTNPREEDMVWKLSQGNIYIRFKYFDLNKLQALHLLESCELLRGFPELSERTEFAVDIAKGNLHIKSIEGLSKRALYDVIDNLIAKGIVKLEEHLGARKYAVSEFIISNIDNIKLRQVVLDQQLFEGFKEANKSRTFKSIETIKELLDQGANIHSSIIQLEGIYNLEVKMTPFKYASMIIDNMENCSIKHYLKELIAPYQMTSNSNNPISHQGLADRIMQQRSEAPNKHVRS